MRITCILVFLCLTYTISAQNDSSVFDKQTEIATSEYIFKVPSQWKNVQQIDLTSKDRKFEITGVGLPTECNHAPVTGTLTLRKYECGKLSTAEDYIISEITSYPDRVTEAGCNYQTDTLKIKSGEKATLISTRFLRRTKLSNYSRFDLIVYSKKRKAAYMFTITFQYREPTYVFEADNKLTQYALGVFEGIVLR